MFREHANVVPRSRLFNDESSSPHDDINYHLSRIMKNQFKTFHPERYQTNDYPDPDLSNDESSEEDEFSEGKKSICKNSFLSRYGEVTKSLIPSIYSSCFIEFVSILDQLNIRRQHSKFKIRCHKYKKHPRPLFVTERRLKPSSTSYSSHSDNVVILFGSVRSSRSGSHKLSEHSFFIFWA